ncbi:transcription factor TFIIIC subunit tfc4 [Fusarium oxysporum]|nr:transcription factor TFIIIC subunit tfc4 [Fusarium oxysporum]
MERQQDNASDADSDLEELEGDIAKLDETVRTFWQINGVRMMPHLRPVASCEEKEHEVHGKQQNLEETLQHDYPK